MNTTVETVGSRAERPAGAAATPRTHLRRTSRTGLVRRGLLVSDVCGLAIAYIAAQAAGGVAWAPAELVAFLVLVPVWIAATKLFGLYDADVQRIDHSTLDELVAVSLLATVVSWALFAASHAAGRVSALSGRLLVFWLVAIVAVIGGRGVVRGVVHRRPGFRQRAIILGGGEAGRLVARKLRQHAEYGVDVVGFVDEPLDGAASPLGTPDELERLVKEHAVDRVIVAFGGQSREATLATVRSLRELDVYIDLVPRLHEIVGPSGRIHSVEGMPLIDLPPVRLSPSSRFVKRAFDIVGALGALTVTAPLFVVVPLLIRLESSGPALFRQTRLGEHMREFTVLKFRTMRVGVDEAQHREFIRASMDAAAEPQANGLYKLERAGDVTRIGAFLRSTSLDELPQLLNILRGDMSLVGPRPCIPYETQFFLPHHFERFLVPAGLTGLWQVTARAHATFGEALDMDVAYARGRSLGLDLMLVLRTIRDVLTRKGTA